MTLDLIIRGGTIYDGTGKPGVVADIGVAGGAIVEVGNIAERASQEVDHEVTCYDQADLWYAEIQLNEENAYFCVYFSSFFSINKSPFYTVILSTCQCKLEI